MSYNHGRSLAFVPSYEYHVSYETSKALKHYMVGSGGGKGWENNSYLDSLNGDENDRSAANKKYEEFSKSRQNFLKRQEEAMKDPRVQKFIEARNGNNMSRNQGIDVDGEGEGIVLEDGEIVTPIKMDMEDMMMDSYMGDEMRNGENSGGGSRFQNMMERSRRLQQMQQNQQQRYLSNPFLDDDNDNDNDNDLNGGL